MNLDKILEFFFRKATGILIAIFTTAIAAFCMSGCMTLDFCACACYNLGAPMCDSVCESCSCGLCEDCFKGLGDGLLGCSEEYDRECLSSCSESGCKNLVNCLFSPDGCTQQCGEDVYYCGGANYSFFEATCVHCNFCGGEYNQLYPEATDTCSCANCTIFYNVSGATGCSPSDCNSDPKPKPEPKPELLATVILVDYNGNRSEFKIYNNTTSIDYKQIPGMMFEGYYSGEGGTGVRYTEGGTLSSEVRPANGATLYAYYTDVYPNSTHYIKFYSYVNGTETLIESVKIPYGADLSEYLPEASLVDHTFVGWSTKTEYSDETLISLGDELYGGYYTFFPRSFPSGFASISYEYDTEEQKRVYTYYLYAIFEPCDYELTVEYVGITKNSETLTVLPSGTLAGLTLDERLDGFLLKGLFLDPYGYTPCDMEANFTEDMTVYAVYGRETMIHFFDTTGEHILYSNSYAAGFSYELPPHEQAGYTFLGWRFVDTAAFGNSTYTSLSVVENYNEASMIPVWQNAEYTITYIVNGKPITVTPAESIYYFGEGKQLIDLNPASYGAKYYTFAGWYTDESFSTDPLTSISTTAYGDKTFYAKLNPKTIQIIGDDPSTGIPYVLDVKYGETFKMEVPSRNHYTFLGWYIGTVQVTDGNGYSLAALESGLLGFNDSILDTGYATLEARWERTLYTVTFTADGETFYTSTGRYNDTVAVPSAAPTKEGHNFVEWRYNGSAVTSIQVTGNVTVEAHFEPKTYTVYFFRNDGSGEFETVTYSYNASSIPFTTPTREGYSFTGWCNDAAGTTVLIYATGELGRAFPLNVDGVELYARWLELEPISE